MNTRGKAGLILLGVLLALAIPLPAKEDPQALRRQAEAGLKALLTQPMTGRLATRDELARVWTVWSPKLRAAAERAKPAERRRLIFSRYGFVARPGGKDPGLPVGYTDDGRGGFVTNCFACHAGKVAGKTILGAPNTHMDYATLFEDLNLLRSKDLGQPTRRELIQHRWLPNINRGLSNAFAASVLLGSMRDKDMNRTQMHFLGIPVSHDEDAPAWWTFAKKKRIYWTGFAHPSVRTLMQLFTDPSNSGARLRALEADFKNVRVYLQTLKPPRYPYPIDAALAARGAAMFSKRCAGCHGTYGKQPTYPDRVISLAQIGTDPVRLHALPLGWKKFYNTSWITNYGKYPFELKPKGYQAPPLDGIWASAPYLHNGSIPTVAGVLDPSRRPAVWTRTEDGYDTRGVGLEVKTLKAVPAGLSRPQRRLYYDTRTQGHGSGGHRYAEKLPPESIRALVEYLKTL